MSRVIVASVLCCFAVFAVCGSVSAKPRLQAQAKEQVVDICAQTIWKNVSRDTIAQAAELIKQYDAANDQLAKLSVTGEGKANVYRASGSPVYAGEWPELREALQAMLNKRIANLTCKLRALGVNMTRQVAVEVSRSATN